MPGVVTPVPVGGAAAAGLAVLGSPVGGGDGGGGGPPPSSPAVVVTMPSSVDAVASDDVGAAFQAAGGHTLYGAATYFDADQYFYTTVNGIGADPGVAGTAHEVALTGTAPFSAAAWAAEADSVAAAAGYTTSRVGAVLTVSGNGVDAVGAVAAQAATIGHDGRGEGTTIGASQESAASSEDGNSTAWIQVLPADVPAGAFRVIGFGIRRGANVTSGVRVAVASSGTADGNPEGAIVDHDMTVGDSGANAWHYEYFDADDVVTYTGGERLFIGIHGDGAASSIFAGSSVNDGTYQDGSTNLWLTDGTTGSTTPTVSPVGAIAASFNFGVSVRLIIQEAPYQSDGAYRAIVGPVPGRHDGNLQPGISGVDSIFVGWRFQTPDIDGLSLIDAQVRLSAHAAGDSNQLRFELWDPLGGPAGLNGDVLIDTIGVTSDTQGTGWSSFIDAPIPLAADTVYRHSVKGEPAPGEVSDTLLGVWLGTAGADNTNLSGYPAYGPGVDIADTEREVLADHSGGTDETAIDFDPTVETASPNPSNGTVDSPNNLPMIALFIGKPAPTVTAITI